MFLDGDEAWVSEFLSVPAAFPLLPLWGAWLYVAGMAAAWLVLMLRPGWRRWALGAVFVGAVYVQGVDYLSASSANKQSVAVFACGGFCSRHRHAPDHRAADGQADFLQSADVDLLRADCEHGGLVETGKLGTLNNAPTRPVDFRRSRSILDA